MALQLFMNSVSHGIGSATFHGSWQGAAVGCSGGPPNVQFSWGYASFHELTPEHSGGGNPTGSWSTGVSIDKDRSAKVRAIGVDCDTNKQSTSIQFKTFADFMLVGGLFPGDPTQDSCPVSGSVLPNTNESFATVTIQYRVQGTGPWIETAPIASNLQGSSYIGLGGLLTGLLPATTYEARYRATRGTSNNTEAFSNIGVFTTLSVSVPKTIVVPAAMLSSALWSPPSVLVAGAPPPGGTKVIVAPIMESQAFFPVAASSIDLNQPGLTIISPQQTKLLELDVFMNDEVTLNVEMH